MHRSPRKFLFTVLLLGVPAALAAQEEDPMAAYAAAAAPGAEHEWLAGMAGEHAVTMRMWMEPSAEPAVAHYRARSEMRLGGRYLFDHYEGSFLGMEFEGVGITGYDNTLGRYVSSWIDNLGTGIMHSAGQRDAEGRLVMVGDYVDPASGTTIQIKSVTWLTDEGFMSEMYNIMPDGSEFRSMEFTARRVE